MKKHEIFGAGAVLGFFIGFIVNLFIISFQINNSEQVHELEKKRIYKKAYQKGSDTCELLVSQLQEKLKRVTEERKEYRWKMIHLETATKVLYFYKLDYEGKRRMLDSINYHNNFNPYANDLY